VKACLLAIVFITLMLAIEYPLSGFLLESPASITGFSVVMHGAIMIPPIGHTGLNFILVNCRPQAISSKAFSLHLLLHTECENRFAAGKMDAKNSTLNGSMRKIFLSFLLLAGSLYNGYAHVGSPGVVMEGFAGPYHVLVMVAPPDVIPGTATVTVYCNRIPTFMYMRDLFITERVTRARHLPTCCKR